MHTPGIVPIILPVHILAGGLALVFGYIALYAAKGATLHRKSGLLSVGAMVALSLSGLPGRVPEVLNIPPLLAVAVLAPVVAMMYWLWRVRVRQSFRGIVRASAAEAA